jgi:hypothetical protein
MTVRAIFMAGAAALLPVLVSSAFAEASWEAAPSRFTPPGGPLVLTRTLIRTLADGKQLVVTRRYAIRFTPDGDGFRLDGEQIGAEVKAPAMLAGLAEIERKRINKGLFPARLDANGVIRAGGVSAADPATRNRATAEAGRLIGAAPLPPEAQRERGTVLGQVATTTSVEAWPTFLFNPGPRDRVERRKLALPGGGEGEVEISIRVTGLAEGGLPTSVERTVVTRLSGTSRTSREIWTFTPAQG